MACLLQFQLKTTRYFVWRPQEWGVYLRFAARERDVAELDAEVVHHTAPGVAQFHCYKLAPDEGVSFDIERPDGRGEDEVTITLDSLEGAEATFRLEVPEGVAWELFRDRGDDERI